MVGAGKPPSLRGIRLQQHIPKYFSNFWGLDQSGLSSDLCTQRREHCQHCDAELDLRFLFLSGQQLCLRFRSVLTAWHGLEEGPGARSQLLRSGSDGSHGATTHCLPLLCPQAGTLVFPCTMYMLSSASFAQRPCSYFVLDAFCRRRPILWILF